MDSIKGSSVSLFIYFIPCYKIQTANVKSLKLFRSASARQSPLRHSDPEASSLLQGQKRPRLCPKKPVTANHYRPSLNTRKTFLPRIISFSYLPSFFICLSRSMASSAFPVCCAATQAKSCSSVFPDISDALPRR